MRDNMTPNLKKKLCWNCEGSVSIKNENCPYCGVSLTVSPLLNEVNTSFTPPYRLSEPSSPSIIPSAPYGSSEDLSNPQLDEEESNLSEEPVTDILKDTIISLLMLLFGTVFLIFGLVLWLFSDQNGLLTLSWNGKYWFGYLLFGLPMLVVGWRTTAYIKDEGLN